MGKVFLDKIPATEHIEQVVAVGTDLANGQFLTLGVLNDDGESRIVTPATTEADADVFLADAPIDYGYPDWDLAKYKLKAGKIGRAFHLGKGDVISVTTDLVPDNVAAGNKLTINPNGAGFVAAADGERGIALVIGVENHGFDGDVAVLAIR